MSVHAAAHDPRLAGATVAFCFETLGDLEMEERNLTNEEMSAQLQIISLTNTMLGQVGLLHSEVDTHAQQFMEWWFKDETEVSHVVDTMKTAAKTIGTHWKGSSMDKKTFLIACAILANADGVIMDNERKSLYMIANEMGAMKEYEEAFSGN